MQDVHRLLAAVLTSTIMLVSAATGALAQGCPNGVCPCPNGYILVNGVCVRP